LILILKPVFYFCIKNIITGFDTKLENRLQDQDQSICEGKVIEEKCSNAINNMKSNKAPGLDGLTVEFYRESWGKVNFFLIDVLNKSYDEKLLSFSQGFNFALKNTA
jgi:hypothetical protein